eukprot:702702-Pyramimonas_sp.AAC.1
MAHQVEGAEVVVQPDGGAQHLLNERRAAAPAGSQPPKSHRSLSRSPRAHPRASSRRPPRSRRRRLCRYKRVRIGRDPSNRRGRR